jgi:cytochrome c biogenesis protein CcmG/thiol:disulfide interchange protein DsbE
MAAGTAAATTQGAAAGRRPGLIGPFSGRQLAAILLVLVVSAGLLLLLTAPVASPSAALPARPGASFVPFASAEAGLRVGAPAPELAGDNGGAAVSLTDLDGRPVRLADLRGRPVWLNFFASWCPPCQEETPTLERVYETHQSQGLAVVGVSVQESSADDVRAYAQTYGLQYPIGFDATSAVYHAYHVFGLPTQVFIDRDGIVRAVVNGPLSQVEAERILAPLLEPPHSARP